MFSRFVCDLLSFRVRKFPEKSETQEPIKIIVERTLYKWDRQSSVKELFKSRNKVWLVEAR